MFYFIYHLPCYSCEWLCSYGPQCTVLPGAYNAVTTALPLIALFTCCWMSFEAVLGNKEFEFVVSEMTLTVVTRRSTSGGHGVSVLLLVSVTGSGSEAQTVSLVLITSSTSLLSARI